MHVDSDYNQYVSPMMSLSLSCYLRRIVLLPHQVEAAFQGALPQTEPIHSLTTSLVSLGSMSLINHLHTNSQLWACSWEEGKRGCASNPHHLPLVQRKGGGAFRLIKSHPFQTRQDDATAHGGCCLMPHCWIKTGSLELFISKLWEVLSHSSTLCLSHFAAVVTPSAVAVVWATVEMWCFRQIIWLRKWNVSKGTRVPNHTEQDQN